MSIKKWIRNWLNDSGLKLRIASDIQSVESPENGTQISINKAINGRVLILRTYRSHNPHQPSNWVTEMYVIKEGESLTEALTMLLTLKGSE